MQSARLTALSSDRESGISRKQVLASCAEEVTAQPGRNSNESSSEDILFIIISFINILLNRGEAFLEPVSHRSVYLVPKYKKNIPINTKTRSMALLFKFFSRKKSAPQANDTTTLPLRIMETTLMSESS